MEGRNKLLLLFIHGFKGDDETFMDFPNRLEHVLTTSLENIDTESIVYPQYETQGDLRDAVEKFCLWMEDIVQEREETISKLHGKGNVWVCLLGHSMGGILAADTIIKYANQNETTSTHKPNIVGLLAFDTPFYGVHSDVFSKAALGRAGKVTQSLSGTMSLLSTAATASGMLSTTKKTTSTASNWGKWGLVAGIAAVGVAGAAYYHKEKMGKGVEWLGSHLEYVGVLWNETELKQRVEKLVKVPNTLFHCYYTQIPPDQPLSSPRTFIKLPPQNMMSYFSATACKEGKDEIDAHICMFDPEHNDFYFDLGHVTIKYLSEMVANIKS